MEILPVFCDIDDFCQFFEPLWTKRLLESRQRQHASTLCLSEVMTIIVLFHASNYRNFKAYYTKQVVKHYLWSFPKLVSYHRFVELMPSALVPLCGYLQSRKGQCSGISPGDLVELYQTEYIRTVPVVSVNGIQDFMKWASRLEFDMSY